VSYVEEWDDEEGDAFSELEELDEDDEWVCAFPNECLMAYTEHMRSECYTVEMAEEYMSGE